MTKLITQFIAVTAVILGTTAIATSLASTPAPLPVLAEVTMCDPAVTVGYVLIEPSGYVGTIDTPSQSAREAYRVLKDAGKIRSGLVHFATCPQL